MRHKKGFTLIEMLAVIVILGLVMAIAIPVISSYIMDSRKKTYVATAKEYISIASNLIAKQELIVRNTDTVYYIHIDNLITETKKDSSPFGKWSDAYVLVTIDPSTKNLTYYWTSADVEGYRVDITKDSALNKDNVYLSDNKVIDTSIVVDGKTKIVIYDKNGNKISS